MRQRPHRRRVAAAWALCALVAAGCGSGEHGPSSPRATTHPPAARHARAGSAGHAKARRPVRLRLVATRSLPAPVQLPGLARVGATLLAAGGLDRADASVADVTRVRPGAPRRVGALPAAVHDAGAAALGGRVYVFGGGSAAGPTDRISAVTAAGRVRTVARLPGALSDAAAVALGGTAYVIGGDATSGALRTVLAYRPGGTPRRVATLPHALRYAAAAVVGGRILVAGGTDGTTARAEILSVEPHRHRVRVIGRLPAPLAHAAGAALGGTFYVLGGRGDAPAGQRRGIWAIAPSGAVRAAGRLPVALSDLSAVADRGRVVVVGGRDRRGTVHGEVYDLAPRAADPPTARATAALRPAAPRPGLIPRPASPSDVYAADRPGALSSVVRRDPARVYVPDSVSNTVEVIDQRNARVIRRFRVGAQPQHVTPSWDLRTLWVTNDLGNSLTPIDARTGRPGRPVPVNDPYNLYFTADGRRAIVVAESHRELDFRTPHTMRLTKALRIPACAGMDHMDYTADGRRALVSCEFAGRAVVVDLVRERVVKTIALRHGAMPQDVKLSPDGRTFYIADMMSGGVWLIDARRLRVVRFQRTGAGAHGLYPSRDSRDLYVSNRDAGTITVLSFRTRRPVRTWRIPGGGSPDMGGVSADGRVLWLSGRYDSEVYAISTQTGRLLHRIRVGQGPHGMCVWPQPGRYSIGHTGILR
jgi:YVTN family beta-propeller protein